MAQPRKKYYTINYAFLADDGQLVRGTCTPRAHSAPQAATIVPNHIGTYWPTGTLMETYRHPERRFFTWVAAPDGIRSRKEISRDRYLALWNGDQA